MPEAVYFLCLDGERVAELSAPRWVDMFWWEYRLLARSEEADHAIRDPILWQKMGFTIVDAEGRQPNRNTFSAAHEDFCERATDRLLFRSLPPPR